MKPTPSPLTLRLTPGPLPAIETIEWEELPPFEVAMNHRQGHAWVNTMPADLEPAMPSQPFQEALSGLATREVHDRDVFRHFFG